MQLFFIIGGADWFLRDLLRVWKLTHEVRVFHKHRDTTTVGFLRRKWRAFQNIQSLKSQEIPQNYEWSDLTFIEWANYTPRFLTNRLSGATPIIVRVPGLPRGSRAYHFRKSNFAKITKVVLLSETMRQQFRTQYPTLADRTVVIPEAVRGEFFQPRSTDFRTGKIAVVSRLSVEKRIDLILHTMQPLLANGSQPLTVHIAGEGTLRDPLVRLAKELDIADKVFFEGWIPNPQLPRWLADKDLLMNTSEREGFPSAILEGMAAGVIPIIRNWMGAEELFPSSFVYAYEGAQFREAVRATITDFYRELSNSKVRRLRSIAQNFAERYHVKKAITRYEQLFQQYGKD